MSLEKLATYGTDVFPLHPSGVKSTVVCPARGALGFLAPVKDAGGPAGDSGSAMHKAAAAWHKGADIAGSLEVMGAHMHEYPQADLGDAAKMFMQYAADGRNLNAKLLLIEQPLAFNMACLPNDPTGLPISVVGTCDQVREVDGRAQLFDIKTSKKKGYQQLRSYSMQIAAYCIGASILLNRRVDPGALICPRQYDSGGPVFWRFTWTFDDCEHILAGVRRTVANIRAGDIHHTPGDDCEYCLQGGPDVCLPKLKELRLRTRT